MHHVRAEGPSGAGRQIERISDARKSRELDDFPEPHRTVIDGITVRVQRTDFHVRHTQAHFRSHRTYDHTSRGVVIVGRPNALAMTQIFWFETIGRLCNCGALTVLPEELTNLSDLPRRPRS